MSYFGSQTVGQKTQHDEEISFVGNIATSDDNLVFAVNTTNIVNIDLLEFHYRPHAGEVTPVDLDLIDLCWRNTNLNNNSGNSTLTVSPALLADGTYRYEPNHPPNLFYREDSLHSHLRGKFSLEIKKRSTGTRLNTQRVYLRFKVTNYMSKKLDFVGKFEPAILNQ